MRSPLITGFSSLLNEMPPIKLGVEGHIPAWLQGTLIRNGPAKFKVGEEKLAHWFDGFAMLYRFYFHGNDLWYSNKFINSNAYVAAQLHKKICFGEFATSPATGFLKKFSRLWETKLTDNTNINVMKLDDVYLALGEPARYNQFDPKTLNTLGHFHYKENLPGQITTAHPQYDYARKELYNFTVELGRRGAYNVYKVAAGTQSQQLLAKIPVAKPAYQHSFAMTENYVILIEPPLRFNFYKFAILGSPYIESYDWDIEQGTRFTIIDKNSGEMRLQISTNAFFFFHQINAFESHDEIFIDMPIFTDADIIQQLYLKNIDSHKFSTAMPMRFHIKLAEKKISQELLADSYIELPRINYEENNSLNYRYFYAVGNRKEGDFGNQLVKIDVNSGMSRVWYHPYCFPGEPVFVKDKTRAREDDGLVLSVVLNTQVGRSFLLVLDAISFQEIARAPLPHHIPFGFHGQFFEGT